MMIPAKTDIKVALIGHVSVGKTTVLNALFRDKFGEVSMNRTTAGINFFRIKPRRRPKNEKKDDANKDTNEPADEKGETWADIVSYNTKPAGLFLKEITADNKTFRNSNNIHKKVFDIELDEPLCDMREDANLVVVDIPGINEAGAGSKYRDFVEETWDTFDVAIVVMDGKQGVNTEEQINMLKFVKHNQEKKRHIPLIILLNKVDDPDDEEQTVLVEESRKEVEKQFNVGDTTQLLKKILQSTPNQTRKTNDKLIVVIPTSAMHAYFYRTASLMTINQFKKFDKDLIEKIGREEVGRFRWKLLSQDRRYQAVYDAVSEQGQYIERLEATNFDKFLGAVRYFIGDEKVQLDTMREHVMVLLRNLSPERGLASQFESAYEKSKIVGISAENLSSNFWSNYDEFEKKVISDFVGPTSVSCLSEAMVELKCFYELASQASWKKDQTNSLERMRGLVRRPLLFVFEKTMECRKKLEDGSLIPKSLASQWTDLSPYDWKLICSSFLLLSYNKTFCNTFGREKMFLEIIADSLSILASNCAYCGRCKRLTWVASAGNYHNSGYRANCCGSSVHPMNETMFSFTIDSKSELCPAGDMFTQGFALPLPTTFADPTHWGHLAWIYCELVDSHM